MNGTMWGASVSEWLLPVAVLACLFGVLYIAWRLGKKPTAEQIHAVKEWLLFAVTEAERALGAKTGKLKLRMVYDKFIQRFPSIARYIPFETFAVWVDTALEDMKRTIAGNPQVSAYVAGDRAQEE